MSYEVVMHIDGEYPLAVSGRIEGDLVYALHVEIEIKGVGTNITDTLIPKQLDHLAARLKEYAEDGAETA